jgi:methylated-DNA-[protein]-cysteine S-methyltransferase
MNYYDSFESRFGPFSVAVAEDGAVIATAFGEPERLESLSFPLSTMVRDSGRIAHVRQQLEEYFAGERQSFDLELAPQGTPYRHRVWRALLEIPYGETRSYGDLARDLQSSARAVGGANGANALCPIIGCHRVIGADGSLTGFGFGVDLKKQLLDLERAVVARTRTVVAV